MPVRHSSGLHHSSHPASHHAPTARPGHHPPPPPPHHGGHTPPPPPHGAGRPPRHSRGRGYGRGSCCMVALLEMLGVLGIAALLISLIF